MWKSITAYPANYDHKDIYTENKLFTFQGSKWYGYEQYLEELFWRKTINCANDENENIPNASSISKIR